MDKYTNKNRFFGDIIDGKLKEELSKDPKIQRIIIYVILIMYIVLIMVNVVL